MRDKETNIDVVSGSSRDVTRVLLDPNSELRYSFSFDDNIFFLWDLFVKNSKSLFDNFYLRGLRDLHERYGAKFVLNLFYEIHERYKGTFGPFNLSQFPNRFKEEWNDNVEWLRLAFHSLSEFPNRPYINVPLSQIKHDFDLITEEISRFAGEAYIPTSITHWTSTTRESFQLLKERGVRTLCGYFVDSDGSYDINYGLDNERSRYLSKHKAVKDFKSGIVFCILDLLFNVIDIDKVLQQLESVMNNPKKRGVLVLSTHEQYFWPQYNVPSSWFGGDPSGVTEYKYIPNHFDRLEEGIRIITEGGYKPVFLHECYDV